MQEIVVGRYYNLRGRQKTLIYRVDSIDSHKMVHMAYSDNDGPYIKGAKAGLDWLQDMAIPTKVTLTKDKLSAMIVSRLCRR